MATNVNREHNFSVRGKHPVVGNGMESETGSKPVYK